MTEYKSDLIRVLSERGFINQCTDIETLDDKASKEVITAYIGFDCTATSLHIGSLLPIMVLRWMQKTGHKPVVLMGGGTTKVGDPSGKDATRPVMTDEFIANNMAGIKTVFDKYLTFGDGKTDAMMVNNDDWLKELSYLDFLRDYGRHFTINRMMTFDSVKLRLDREQPLTFLEFNYMILQAYDFMELNRRHGLTLQMGGSDQWGNIINGVELTRRVSGNEVYGLTVPLLTTSNGQKMGKTANGAVWLNDDMLSAYDFWQFWRNTSDADVGRFLRLFTELPLDEIAKLEALEGQELNEAKKILAHEVTKLCRGEAAALNAAETARRTFEEGALGKDLPTFEIELGDGIPAFDAMRRVELAKSGGEARRAIKGGGARLNDEPINDENILITAAHANEDGLIKLSFGKKRHALIKPV